MNKKKLLSRMSQYGSVSGAFLAIHPQADAQTSYVNYDPDLFINSNDTLYLDPDGNGTNNFIFWIESMQDTILTSAGNSIPFSWKLAYGAGLAYNEIIGNIGTNSGYVFQSAYHFFSGEEIQDTLPFFGNEALLGGFISYDGLVQYSGGPWAGTTNEFIGLRLNIDGSDRMAWMRLSVGNGGSSIEIADFAYENTIGTNIVAGFGVPIENLSIIDKPEIYSFQNQIFVHLNTNLQSYKIMLFDLAGNCIEEKIVRSSDFQIQMPQVAQGIYLVEIILNEQKFSQQVFLY